MFGYRLKIQFFVVCLGIMLTGWLVPSIAPAQMVEGEKVPGFAQTFDVEGGASGGRAPAENFTATLVESSVPGGVLWPGEQPTFTIQIVSTGPGIKTTGKVEVIRYGTRGRPNDIWVPDMFRIDVAAGVPVEINLESKAYVNLKVSPEIPATFGAYGVVVDLGKMGRRFVCSFVRTFEAGDARIQYPKFCLDALPIPVLKRLGVHAIRLQGDYRPSDDPGYAKWWDREVEKMQAYKEANISVLYMIGAGSFYGAEQPMKTPRPWLDQEGQMLPGKFDIAWMPRYDEDFQEQCHKIAATMGWPKGPINAFSLWNEPWEGISISGWGADMPRYREIYGHMARGVDQARQRDGIDCLIGGCDSSSNAHDKLFGDGKTDFLPYFDFLSIHYQGLAPDSTFKQWVDRKGPRGRVKIWDTESWVANSDDRVAAVVAGDRAAGYDRAMGIYGGNIAKESTVNLIGEDGTPKRGTFVNAWSVAAAVGASQHFIGERDFKEILFKNGLPWVMVFDGLPGKDGKTNPEDGTIVVVGDLGEEFGSPFLLFRTARGMAEIKHKIELRKKLSALGAPSGTEGQKKHADKERADLQKQIDTPETLSDSSMTLVSGAGANGGFSLFDFVGNQVSAKDGKIIIPLDGRGYFLRADGSAGSFARLIDAVKKSRIEGIEPLAIVVHDMTSPIGNKPTIRLTLTNVMNRAIEGGLKVSVEGLSVISPPTIRLAPGEVKEVLVNVNGGMPNASNSYPVSVRFDAGADGFAVLEETVHVNWIAHRTIAVDGNLDDWKGVLAQPILPAGTGGPTMTEAAWFPFQAFDTTVPSGVSTGFMAYDDRYFYFAAKVADATPEVGMMRFETRDDDQFYYPEKVFDVVRTDVPFQVNWAGQISAPSSDFYTFTFNSTGAVRLIIDGKKIIDDPAFHAPKEVAGQIDLKAGQRIDIQVEYRHGLGPAVCQLFWESKSQKRQLVPPSALYRAKEVMASGLSTRYSAGAGFVGTDSAVDLSFDNLTPETRGILAKREMTWPPGVRRYSYRRGPELPAGNAPMHDNIQIAFNVLSPDRKAFYPCPPGTMPGFVNYQDTDYEYALNPVAPQYGGGVEVWRLAYPGMPPKHFYPRQPASTLDGPVKEAKLVIRQDGRTRIVEAALPWSEIPEVKKCVDAGRPIKFSFRVNDDKSTGCMELSRERSVAKRNRSFHVDWTEHWANELEFGWEK